uniref:reverse transcriptase domain-containing protein n=1 Tax=Zoogloea sp. LCSB751 TaxID=1965277 RepID=UPI0020B12325
DLEKFFDRVNHDILIARLKKRIEDAGVIRLIRAYLNAGIMDAGVVMERHLGTPQGGPLSPLLANVLLDEVGQALQREATALRATPSPACDPAQALEAGMDDLSRAQGTGSDGGRCQAGSGQLPPVVAQQRSPAQDSADHCVL